MLILKEFLFERKGFVAHHAQGKSHHLARLDDEGHVGEVFLRQGRQSQLAAGQIRLALWLFFMHAAMIGFVSMPCRRFLGGFVEPFGVVNEFHISLHIRAPGFEVILVEILFGRGASKGFVKAVVHSVIEEFQQTRFTFPVSSAFCAVLTTGPSMPSQWAKALFDPNMAMVMIIKTIKFFRFMAFPP
jgi:hypothetical protein